MKNAIVFGASGEIGAACARALKDDYFVFVHYNSSKEAATELADEISGQAVHADVTSEQEMKELFNTVRAKRGKVDAIVYSSGIALKKMICDTSLDEWKKIIDVDLTGAFLASKLALEDMMFSGGKIINISSVFGLSGASCEGAYSAAKAGMIGLTKSIAREYTSVCANCVCPGAIDTKMNGNLSQEEKEALACEIPKQRFGTPREVAALVKFLASPDADYITGEAISINGGMYI